MDTLLTWYQALQLLALGPCLFMLFFLCIAARKFSQIFVPVLYFLSLICSFSLPLIDIFTTHADVRGILLMGESLTPALSFLLIMQFIWDRIPALPYWTILSIPLIGGSSIVYATLITNGELCIYDNLCTEPVIFKELYEIFSASLTFLLTMVVIRQRLAQPSNDTLPQKRNKYALVLALIVLNLALLAIDLAEIGGYVNAERAMLAIVVVRIGFIYLVLTSVFRVFDRSFEIDYERIPHMRPQETSERDLALAEKIRVLLVQDKLYRSMELSRSSLALRLAITEHQLSRIINQCFSQNFSTLVNHYRILEAKDRLAKEETAITVIAFEVGFSSIPSFNRVFKNTVGISPSEHRSKSSATQR